MDDEEKSAIAKIVSLSEGAAEEEDHAVEVWEAPLQKSWEDVKLDDSGLLLDSRKQNERSTKQSIRKENGKVFEKGVVRYLCLVLDVSTAMNNKDLKPSRWSFTVGLVENFIVEYFDQNPLSQLSLIVSFMSRAEKLTDLSGNPQHHIDTLRSFEDGGGDISLQNCMDMSFETLRQTPPYGSKEVLVIMGALHTTDPGDIFDSIKNVKADNIRCSVMSLSAEVYVCKILAKSTGGSYNVCMHEKHYTELMNNFVTPKPLLKSQKVSRRWIRMGFPQNRVESFPSLCCCHKNFTYSGFFCPVCKSKFCELPMDCSICGLTLISSPLLARSYHHLFPIESFEEVDHGSGYVTSCSSCLKELNSDHSLILVCKKCNHIFCVNCDKYIHESLRNCPGCLSSSSLSQSIDDMKPELPSGVARPALQADPSAVAVGGLAQQHPPPPGSMYAPMDVSMSQGHGEPKPEMMDYSRAPITID